MEYTYTISEAAAHANTSAAAIKQAIRRGKLEAHKAINPRDVLQWFIEHDDLQSWINSPRKPGRPQKCKMSKRRVIEVSSGRMHICVERPDTVNRYTWLTYPSSERLSKVLSEMANDGELKTSVDLINDTILFAEPAKPGYYKYYDKAELLAEFAEVQDEP